MARAAVLDEGKRDSSTPTPARMSLKICDNAS
jgi:hypothetical protein